MKKIKTYTYTKIDCAEKDKNIRKQIEKAIGPTSCKHGLTQELQEFIKKTLPGYLVSSLRNVDTDNRAKYVSIGVKKKAFVSRDMSGDHFNYHAKLHYIVKSLDGTKEGCNADIECKVEDGFYCISREDIETFKKEIEACNERAKVLKSSPLPTIEVTGKPAAQPIEFNEELDDEDFERYTDAETVLNIIDQRDGETKEIIHSKSEAELSSYLKNRDSLDEYLHGLVICDELSRDEAEAVLKDYDNWFITAEAGEAYYYDSKAWYILEGDSDKEDDLEDEEEMEDE